MNRKKGIIIGTTGIIIVTLALIGFTYGFYMSLISGNESSKRVKVTAGKSKLEYVELSDEVDTIIGPGYTNTKYFAVKNVGDISGSYYLYLVDVENTFNRKNDIVYTIYRKLYDYSEEKIEPEEFNINGTYDFSSWENVTNNHCSKISEYSDYGDCEYPHEKALLTTQKQTIMDKNDYYIYAFVVTYINQPEIDQISDEESVFSGVVKVYADETGTDVSPFEAGTLADAIYTSALNETNGTIYMKESKEQGSNATLSITDDDDGISYYFGGKAKDNYVNFAGMCWRIVRINGNHTIRLILDDKYAVCNDIEDLDGDLTDDYKYIGDWIIGQGAYGYDIDENNIKVINYLNPQYKGMAYAFENFQDMYLSKYLDKLDYGNWCYDTTKYSDENGTEKINDILPYHQNNTKYFYGAYVRNNINEPSLKCKDGNISMLLDKFTSNEPMYVGTVTLDELVFARTGVGSYIVNDYVGNYYNEETGESRYIYMWTLSPADFDTSNPADEVYMLYPYPLIAFDGDVSVEYSYRPAINLKAGTTFVEGGEGTQSNPYVVE